MAWAGSTRRSRLPNDWPRRVRATKLRAQGECEGISLRGEDRWHVADCTGIGTDCDHEKRGDDHVLTNLRWLSKPCHKHKTQLEANAGNRSARHPNEAHPGLT